VSSDFTCENNKSLHGFFHVSVYLYHKCYQQELYKNKRKLISYRTLDKK